MNKKHLSLLLTLLLLGSLFLAGCGGDQPEKNSTPNPPPGAQSDAPKASPDKPKVPDEKELIADLIAQGQEIKEMSYDMVMIGAGLSSESEAWIKDKKMKTDTVFNGQRLISVFDWNKDEVISYLPGDMNATKIKIGEYQGQDSVTPLTYTADLDKADYRPAGMETVNGMECQVLKVITVDGSFQEWLSTEYGIVVKVEGEFNGQGITIEFKNIQLGPGSVPSDTFNLPEGMEVIDFNAMMPNSPEAKGL